MAPIAPRSDAEQAARTPLDFTAWDPRDVARLRRAVARARRVDHPNVCRVRGLVESQGRVTLATDPSPVENLAARMTRGGPLALPDARLLARDLCAGLAALHGHGVCHGELCPTQVGVLADRYVILGAGLASARSTVDERDDVRGVGAVLYEALTGVPPFGVPAEALPSELRAPILRCLQRDPGRRFGTIAELAVALGLPGREPPRLRRPARRGLALPAAVLALAAVAVGWWGWRSLLGPTHRPAAGPAAIAVSAGPVRAGKAVLALVGFRLAGADAATERLLVGLRELLAIALREAPDVEVAPAALDADALVASARRAGVDLVLVVHAEAAAGGALALDAKLVDVGSSALRFAERAVVGGSEDLLRVADDLAAKILRSIEAPPAGGLPRIATLVTGSAAAFDQYLAGIVALERDDNSGAEAALRKAAGLDSAFLQPRVALVELLRAEGRTAEMDEVVAQARPLASRAGEWGALTLRRLSARTPEERIAALEATGLRYPHDPAVSEWLAAAYRAAGRGADCVTAGQRTLMLDPGAGAAARDVAWCSLEAGDPQAAVATAKGFVLARPGLGQAEETLGDVLTALGRYGGAREAYRGAIAGGAESAEAKLLLVELHAEGRCEAVLQRAKAQEDRAAANADLAATLAAAEGLAAVMCGDWSAAAATAAWAKVKLPASSIGDALAVWADAAHGQAGSFDRARALAGDGRLWTGAAEERALRFGPLLVAGRAEGKAAEALALVPLPAQPMDRYALARYPLLLEIALARVESGDAEEAGLACNELLAAAPDFAPGLYCAGRAAQARAAWSDAFRNYRAFLDRWADAGDGNRLVADARRRNAEVVRQARGGK